MQKQILPLLTCVLCLLAHVACAAGLSTTFGEVKVENIGIGQVYSMENEANTPLVVKNTSDYELELQIDVLIPRENELIEGYEAIPDANWIRLRETSFTMPPQSEVSTDVIIDIPNDDIHIGKKYQVYIWSHTIGSPIAVGLRSKLLISIAGQKEEKIVSYTGVLEKIQGVSFVMAGTHKLMDGKKRICLLTSRKVNLDDYLNYKVKVTGIPEVAVEEGSSMLIVMEVESLE